jgi:hypothetical protein
MGRGWKRTEASAEEPRQSLTRQLFFRWIKMLLRTKAFFSTSENAVKSQIWIAVSVYVLVAIIKKRLNLSRSPYEMVQILSLNLFEQIPLIQRFRPSRRLQNRPRTLNS